jgi:hypothetical protein
MANKMSHGERVLLGRIGAYTALSRHSGYEMTAPARRGFASKFEREVDPEGVLDPAERARRAEMARKAYFARLALLSAQARRMKAARKRAQASGDQSPS